MNLAEQHVEPIGPRKPYERRDIYLRHYKVSSQVDIVGIACLAFVRGLYPSPVDRNHWSRSKRLDRLKKTVLVKMMQATALQINVYISDPTSDFVSMRSIEERNPRCAEEILKAIETLKVLYDDLMISKGNHPQLHDQSHLSFSIFKENPYVSLFKATHVQADKPDVMYVGLLLQGVRGNQAPMIKIESDGKQAEVFRACSEHLTRLARGSDELLHWDKDSLEFKHDIYERVRTKPELPRRPEKADVLIVTPLPEERRAVLAKLPVLTTPLNGNCRPEYELRDLPVTLPKGRAERYRVVVVTLSEMGLSTAAAATGAAINRWHPKLVLLVGIAGGIRRADVKLGDVLIAEQIVDYEGGKPGKEIHPRWKVFQANTRCLIVAKALEPSNWLSKVIAVRPALNTLPRCRFGVVFSGNKVIVDPNLSEEFRKIWEKAIGWEMEAAGVVRAVEQCEPRPDFFMVRAASDLSDSKKNSAEVAKWRSYACDVAASFAITLLESRPIPTSKWGRKA